jgi:phenylacetate-coenzyme A ligase PaaK-like adenylate-forming protein
MSPHDVVKLLIKYHINILTGDSGQVVQMVHYISTLPEEERALIKLDKIIYTSEVLTSAQKAHIKNTLSSVKIFSFLGSAETGVWAASSPDINGKESTTSEEDFVFDTRSMLVEVFPPSITEGGPYVGPLPEGKSGMVIQTSLSRLRNPLVRYVTGDIGSVHPLPEHSRDMIPVVDWPFLRILRLQGRDKRISFDWDGDYFQFEDLAALLNNEECGILQWQIVLDKLEPSLESSLEIRLMCSPRTSRVLSEKALIDRIKGFLHVMSTNDYRFKITFVDELDGFIRSSTGRKVIKFVNRYD